MSASEMANCTTLREELRVTDPRLRGVAGYKM